MQEIPRDASAFAAGKPLYPGCSQSMLTPRRFTQRIPKHVPKIKNENEMKIKGGKSRHQPQYSQPSLSRSCKSPSTASLDAAPATHCPMSSMMTVLVANCDHTASAAAKTGHSESDGTRGFEDRRGINARTTWLMPESRVRSGTM